MKETQDWTTVPLQYLTEKQKLEDKNKEELDKEQSQKQNAVLTDITDKGIKEETKEPENWYIAKIIKKPLLKGEKPSISVTEYEYNPDGPDMSKFIYIGVGIAFTFLIQHLYKRFIN